MEGKFSDKLSLYFSIGLGTLLFLAQGINFAQVGPLFPTVADERDISQTAVGVVVGVYDVGFLITSLISTYIFDSRKLEIVFCSGGLVSGISTVCFGLAGKIESNTIFVVSSLLLRFIMGVGGSLVWITSIPLLTKASPRIGGIITSLVEVLGGAGMSCGVVIGSALYSLAGYSMPFVAIGVIEATIVLLFFVFYRRVITVNADEEEGEKKHGLLWLSIRPLVVCMVIPAGIAGAAFGYQDTALSPYMTNTFGIAISQVGYVFLPYTVAYLFSALLSGFLIDKGYASGVYVITAWLLSVSFFLTSSPGYFHRLENLVVVCSFQVVLGISHGFFQIPQYLLFYRLTRLFDVGDEETTKFLASTVFMTALIIGKSIGASTFGGFIYDALGYYHSSALLGATQVICAFMGTFAVVRGGLARRLYYSDESADERTELLQDSRHTEIDDN